MRHAAEIRTYYDESMLVALAVLFAALELGPGASWHPIDINASDTEMTGVDALPEYDIPIIEDPVIVPPDIDNVLDNSVIEVDPNLVINMTGDTTGLDVVNTFDPNIMDPDIHNNPDGGIPVPGTFIPHSVPPRCTFRPAPDYPEIARQAGIEGRVTVQLFIDTDGVPLDVVVVGPSGFGAMDSAAVSSAWLTRWAPAERDDGQPVGVWTSVIYDFQLED
jgi:TonB family protein